MGEQIGQEESWEAKDIYFGRKPCLTCSWHTCKNQIRILPCIAAFLFHRVLVWCCVCLVCYVKGKQILIQQYTGRTGTPAAISFSIARNGVIAQGCDVCVENTKYRRHAIIQY